MDSLPSENEGARIH